MPDQSVYEEPTSINPATINTSPQAINTSSSPLEKIGKPDLDGWLKKKSDRYGTWKSRYILLKGLHLYFMKSPQEKKIKGWIPLNGYKVLPDSDSSRGNYGFKLTHPTLPSHYFASEDPLIVRKFMKALMKSSIVRDFQGNLPQSCTASRLIKIYQLRLLRHLTSLLCRSKRHKLCFHLLALLRLLLAIASKKLDSAESIQTSSLPEMQRSSSACRRLRLHLSRPSARADAKASSPACQPSEVEEIAVRLSA